MLIFTEGGLREVGESILKQDEFSEALAIVFPTAILQIDYTSVHIASNNIHFLWKNDRNWGTSSWAVEEVVIRTPPDLR